MSSTLQTILNTIESNKARIDVLANQFNEDFGDDDLNAIFAPTTVEEYVECVELSDEELQSIFAN